MKKRKRNKRYSRPDGCFSPNEIAKELDITGEAIKQWIYTGRLKAAKGSNGYWWIRRQDLKEFMESKNKLEFKFHKIN